MELIAQQVRLAARSLLRAPAFAATAALTLALGIGLSTAVFAVADALLIRRLPVRDQDRVIALWAQTPDGKFANFPLGLAVTREFARNSTSLAQTGFFAYEGATPHTIRDGDRVIRLNRALVSGNYFQVLESPPALGRTLRPEDDVAGVVPALVLSHRAWRSAFGGDPNVIGRHVTSLETGKSYTIVGVASRGLDYPRGADLWVPLIAASTGTGDSLYVTSFSLDLVGRLRPGATLSDARAELSSFVKRESPKWKIDLRAVAYTLPSLVLGEAKPAVLVVVAASALLLLIACVNVANLLLVRGLERVRELVVRSALGASRARIAAQLLVECGLLAVVGGVLGVAMAVAAVRGFVAVAPTDIPRFDEIGVNGTALIAAVAITVGAVLLFGLAPALFTSRLESRDVLRSGVRHSGSRRMRMATETLASAQLAIAVIVLSAAGVMTRSLIKLQQLDLSFDASRLVVAELALSNDRFGAPERQRAVIDDLVRRVAALPGVASATPVLYRPFAGPGYGISGQLSIPNQSPSDVAKNPMLNLEVVTPSYFATLGVPVLRGRTLQESDREGALPVVVVNESTAQHFWPGEDAVGKRLTTPGRSRSPRAREFMVVGVVADTRYRELRDTRPSVYFPLAQSFFPVFPTVLIVRTRVAGADIIPDLRRVVSDVDPGVALSAVSRVETLLDEPRAQPRMNALLLTVFAAAALSLSAIGLFAIIATMVRQRTRELGIRMALGATSGDLRRMVMVRGGRLASIGIVAGIAGAVAMSRLTSTLVFEVSPTDGLTLVVVAGTVLVVAAVASFVPARASTRIDVVDALRSET